MSGNLENDRSVTSGKMYPIDLAPQKITIVKSVPNAEVKMAHLLPGQSKTPGSGQIITHTGAVGLMRPAAQILSPGVTTQPQMIVSGSPILQATQIVSQGSQIQSTQMLSQSQLLPGSQILSPGTQIISQGTQLSAQVSNNAGTNHVQVSVPSAVSAAQVLSVGGQLVSGSQGLVSGATNLMVSSSVRTLPHSVRVLPQLPHHNTRPVLSNVNATSAPGVLVSKSVTSHVPRGLAAGASLAVRPVAPAASSQGVCGQGAWSSGRGRGALVYGSRAGPRGAAPGRGGPPVTPSVAAPIALVSQTHSTVVTLPTSTVLTSSGIAAGAVRTTPRPAAPAPRPLPLLQRNYQPAKVVGPAAGPRGVVGNSAPAQRYYEVPRARPTVNVVNTVQTLPEALQPPVSISMSATSVLPRPTILRKRESEGSPTKCGRAAPGAGAGWEDVPGGSGGSTTESAASSPRDDERLEIEPRKKPRKQMLASEVRHQEYPPEDPPSPPVPVNPPPKRRLLTSSYVCGWRSTALHFTRPGEVRRRAAKLPDLLALASARHARASADGWKVHHLTAQMADLVTLESDVNSQLTDLLQNLENAGGKATTALQSHSDTLLELVKGNMQRSKIVCEGIQEAKEDILRVFTHRSVVSDILTRQADKRGFRKQRSQS